MSSAVAAVTTGVAAPPSYHAAVDAAAPTLAYRFSEPSGPAINHGSWGAAFNAAHFGTVVRTEPTMNGDTGIRLTAGGFLESLGASPLIGNPTFSIEAVVNLSDPGAASLWGPILQWGDGPAPRTGREVYFGIQQNANRRLFAGFYNAGLRSQQLVPGNTWLHVVWTRAGGDNSESGSIVYVNGEPIAVQRDTSLSPGILTAGSINVSASAFRINAGRDVSPNRYFTGTLDELAVYDRVLMPSEIASRASLVACPSIAAPPESATACRGTSTDFAVTAQGGLPGAGFTYQWQIEDESAPGAWTDLTDGPVTVGGTEVGSVTGSAATEMNFQSEAEAIGFSQHRFRVVVTNTCGGTTSIAAVLSICACLACPADFNQDGGIDGADVDAFFSDWEAGRCDADVNADGGIDGADVDTFFAAWEAGGC